LKNDKSYKSFILFNTFLINNKGVASPFLDENKLSFNCLDTFTMKKNNPIAYIQLKRKITI